MPRAGRKTHLERHRSGGGDGRSGGPERAVLRHQPEPPVYDAHPHREGMGGRGQARASAVRQHGHVDQEPRRKLALVSAQGPAPAHGRRHAALLRRHRGRAVLCHQSARPRHLDHGAFQHEIRERGGRRTHGQLRHRARPPDGTLRSGRNRRAVRSGRHVLAVDLLSGRQPRKDGHHEHALRRGAGKALRRHLHEPHPAFRGTGGGGLPPRRNRRLRRQGLAAQKVLAAAIESVERGQSFQSADRDPGHNRFASYLFSSTQSNRRLSSRRLRCASSFRSPGHSSSGGRGRLWPGSACAQARRFPGRRRRRR